MLRSGAGARTGKRAPMCSLPPTSIILGLTRTSRTKRRRGTWRDEEAFQVAAPCSYRGIEKARFVREGVSAGRAGR